MKRPSEPDLSPQKAPSAAEELKGKFTTFLASDPAQVSAVARVQEKWREQLEEEREIRGATICVAIWDQDTREARLIHPEGTKWHVWLGETRSKQTEKGKVSNMYLNNIETMYLVDGGFLELFYLGLPLSVQRCYHNLLTETKTPLEHYFLYKDLFSKGFVVQRSSTVSSIPSLPFVFDVWGVEKKKNFAKSKPGPPDFRIVFDKFQSQLLTPNQIDSVLADSMGIRVVLALENLGSVNLIELSRPETNLFAQNAPTSDSKPTKR